MWEKKPRFGVGIILIDMTKEEIKKALIKKGWNLEVHLLGSYMAETLYKDISDIFRSNKIERIQQENMNANINYKQEMINYAKQKGL